MVPTGTGFRDHHRTRVKKNIDFGDIASTVSFTPRSLDPDLDALVSGVDPLEREPLAMAAGASIAPAPPPRGVIEDDDEDEEDEDDEDVFEEKDIEKEEAEQATDVGE
jgi:hypothetical protein